MAAPTDAPLGVAPGLPLAAGRDAGPSGDRDRLYSLAGLAGLVVLWQVLGATVLSRAIPTPIGVGRGLAEDWSLYPRNVWATVVAAGKGWLGGNLIAIGMAAVAVGVPATEKTILRFAVATYSMPVIAVGPILAITFSGDAPRAALAGLAVFFTTLVGAILGMRSADKRSIDVIRALGGSSMTALRKVRLRAALPSLFAALRISAPAAVLGAMLGEFMGADRGLGQFMVAAKANVNAERVWGIALVTTAVAGTGYALIAVIGRLVTPWAPRKGQR